MKINFLLPHLKISGGVRVILTYADLLAKKGHEVTVMVQSKNWTRPFFNILNLKPDWFKNLSAKVKRVPDWSGKGVPDADVLVADSWKLAQVAFGLPEAKGKKFHFIQHDERLYHGPSTDVAKIYGLPMQKIVVSNWLKEIIERDFKCSCAVLFNTVDKKLFSPVKTERDKDLVRILLMHHNYEWKGTKEGIQIVQRLKEKYPTLKLIMFGTRRKDIDFPCDEYYYNLPQEKLAWLYSSCDIFLCPSWDEGFGLPSLEAMACKCAVITYDNGGSRDFAFDGQTALVAKRRDINDLSRKLEMLVADKNLREKIAQNGYDFVQKMPTWEEQTEKLEKILASLY